MQPDFGTNQTLPIRSELSNQLAYQQQLLLAQQMNQQAHLSQNTNNVNNNNYPQQVPTRENDEIELSEPKADKPNQVLETVAQQVRQVHQNNKTQHNINKRNQPDDQINHQHKIIYLQKKENITTQYVVIPIFLLILFIILIHPTTSFYLDKYLPPAKDIKGISIRAFILIIAYVIIRYISTLPSPAPKSR
jgi:hypothetical protein